MQQETDVMWTATDAPPGTPSIPFRLPKIVFGSLYGFSPERKAALVGPQDGKISFSSISF